MPGKVQVQTTGHKLDPSLYLPLPEETAFLKSQVGIEDEEELKSHIFAVQKEAWEVRRYPLTLKPITRSDVLKYHINILGISKVMNYMCIRSFGFLTYVSMI